MECHCTIYFAPRRLLGWWIFDFPTPAQLYLAVGVCNSIVRVLCPADKMGNRRCAADASIGVNTTSVCQLPERTENVLLNGLKFLGDRFKLQSKRLSRVFLIVLVQCFVLASTYLSPTFSRRILSFAMGHITGRAWYSGSTSRITFIQYVQKRKLGGCTNDS